MRKRYWLILGVTLVLLASLLLSACTQQTPSSVKPIELKFANSAPPGHPVNLAAEQWKKEVEEKTKGRVKITIFAGGSLCKPNEMFPSTVSGITDICDGLPSYHPGRYPTFEGLNLPGLGAASATSCSLAINEFYETVKPQELDDVKVLWIYGCGPAHLGTVNKAVRSLEDIKGMEIKGTGISVWSIEALGGIGVAIPMPETYVALEKGIVDGVACPPETIKSERFIEFFKYYTVSWIYPSSTFIVAMNKEKWAALPADIQKTMEDINKECPKIYGGFFDKTHKEALDLCKQEGVEIIQLSDEEYARWKQAWKPVYDRWLADMASNGKGEMGQKFVELMPKLLEKYHNKYPDVILDYVKK